MPAVRLLCQLPMSIMAESIAASVPLPMARGHVWRPAGRRLSVAHHGHLLPDASFSTASALPSGRMPERMFFMPAFSPMAAAVLSDYRL